jgi:microcystin-dependent protein
MAIKQYPTGTIVSSASTHPNSIQSGWILCDGSAISRGTYSNLFSLIGTTYGSGNGSTTFNVPNLQEWFIKSVSVATMTSGAGTTVGATTYFQGAQFSYNFGITIGQSEYQNSVGGSAVSSTQAPVTVASSSSGDHNHSVQLETDTKEWGRGVRDGDDNMVPKNEYAQQGRIYDANSTTPGLIDQTWYYYHRSGNQSGSWQQHDLHEHSHSNGAGIWTHTCPALESAATSNQKCLVGIPICSTQQLFINSIINTAAKVPFGATVNASHVHLLCEGYQIQEGPKVTSQGEFSYDQNYFSKRLLSTVGTHNHGSLTVTEQSGISHGSAAHAFSNTITAAFNIANGYPGAGTQNPSGDLKPAALVVGFIIKT